jgi:hypothetical protein
MKRAPLGLLGFKLPFAHGNRDISIYDACGEGIQLFFVALGTLKLLYLAVFCVLFPSNIFILLPLGFQASCLCNRWNILCCEGLVQLLMAFALR